jgi:hypothetical protein
MHLVGNPGIDPADPSRLCNVAPGSEDSLGQLLEHGCQPSCRKSLLPTLKGPHRSEDRQGASQPRIVALAGAVSHRCQVRMLHRISCGERGSEAAAAPGPPESQAQVGWCGHAGAGSVGTALVPCPSFLPALL